MSTFLKQKELIIRHDIIDDKERQRIDRVFEAMAKDVSESELSHALLGGVEILGEYDIVKPSLSREFYSSMRRPLRFSAAEFNDGVKITEVYPFLIAETSDGGSRHYINPAYRDSSLIQMTIFRKKGEGVPYTFKITHEENESKMLLEINANLEEWGFEFSRVGDLNL